MATNASKFVWYELMTSDLAAASSFYSSVLGWSIQDSGMTDRSYHIASAGPTMVGGLMPVPENARAMGMQPCWLGYVGVADVDDYAARVTRAGGAVQLAPTDIPGIGRFAAVTDLHGAAFLLFKGATDQQPAPVPPGSLGHVGWHELHAGQLDTAFEFYAGLFGWTRSRAVDMGPMGVYQLFAAGDQDIGGMMTKTPEMPMPAWLYYFNVEAAQDSATRVTQAGGRVINGPLEVPGPMWIVQCLDPQGAMFALVAPKP